MRLLLQRVCSASVTFEDGLCRSIKSGVLVFVCFQKKDTIFLEDEEQFDFWIKSFLSSKIFESNIFRANGKVKQVSVSDLGGEVLVISSFSLYANLKKGKTPSYSLVMGREDAAVLYSLFIKRLMLLYPNVKEGRFGTFMKISSVNSGPYNLWIDTD